MPDANPEPARGPVPLGLGELRRAVHEQAGLDVVSLVPAGGESGAAFWLRERDGVREIGATSGSAIPPGVDFTHFDFHFLNLLSDGATITGVVDINPPPLAGDRAFDLSTLVFYVYDHDELRRRILGRLFGLAGRQAARAYLAHMVLRQVEWSVRHYPAAPATRRHLRLARLVLGDIGEPGPSRYVLR